MARCPFGPHRLIIASDLTCKRCGEDLAAYAAARDLPIALYNAGRRMWEESKLEAAAGWLHAALELRPDFPEAHWLLGAVEASRGELEHARSHLSQARQLGADVDPEWLCEQPTHAPVRASDSGKVTVRVRDDP